RKAACNAANVVPSSVPRSTPVTVAPSAGSRRSIWIVVVVMVAPVSLHRETEAAVGDDVALDLVGSDADGGVEALDDLVREPAVEGGVGVVGTEEWRGDEASRTEQRHARRRDPLQQLGDEDLAHRREHGGVDALLLRVDDAPRKRVRERDIDPEPRNRV